jgi:hypothetical protein
MRERDMAELEVEFLDQLFNKVKENYKTVSRA